MVESLRVLAEYPAQRRCPFQPPEQHAELRRDHAVFPVSLPSGQTAWLVTGHAEIRKALEDPRLSADMSRDNFPTLRVVPTESPIKGTFMRADGDAHMRVRRMLNREFTVRRAESMRPLIAKIVDERLDALAAEGPGADLIETFALPVPCLLICHLLGVPYADLAMFQQNTQRMLDTKNSPQDVQAAGRELYGYLAGLIDRKLAAPGDDLISRLLADRVETGEVQVAELVSITLLLLVGGHETTAAMIAGGVLTLLRNPAQLARLRADPSLMPGAVEELLRYLTVAQVGTFRVAAADMEIGDVHVRAGDGVVLDLTSGNHDETAFPEPEAVDITRGARRHVAFSHGPHNCVGQSLARLELAIVYERLFARFPGLALAVPDAELTFRPHTIGLAGVERLPVRW